MFILLLVISSLGQVHAEEHLNIYIEGDKQSFAADPFKVEGRTLIPVRDVSETLGATVNWDAETNTVNIVKSDVNLSFTIGSTTALVNDQSVELATKPLIIDSNSFVPLRIKLDTKPLVVDSNSFVPLRFISESLGAVVKWDEENNNVFIQH
jgi:hypothetical protein